MGHAHLRLPGSPGVHLGKPKGSRIQVRQLYESPRGSIFPHGLGKYYRPVWGIGCGLGSDGCQKEFDLHSFMMLVMKVDMDGTSWAVHGNSSG